MKPIIKPSIPKNKFHLTQIIASILDVFTNKIVSDFLFYFKDLKSSLLKCLMVLNKKHYLLAILLPLFTIIFYSLSLPVSFDEAWTYLNFSTKDFFVSLSYYPAPNNHILHSLITNFTTFILPSFPLLSLRLPTIIISILTSLFLLYSITKHHSKKVSIIITGVSSLLFMNIYYSYMSRGYALVLMFFILSLHFTLNLHKNTSSNRDWYWLTICSILGFFTMPSYLYAFVIINTILLAATCTKSAILRQLKFTFITIIVVFILYLPTIIVSGLDSLISNKFVTPIPREDVLSRLPQFLFESLESIMGFNSYISLILILISFVVFIKNKQWFHTKTLIILITLPPLLLLAHSVIPFSRTFNYYGFLIILLFSISIRSIIEKVKLSVTIIALIFIQFLLIFNFNARIYKYEKYSILANELNSKIAHKGSSYLVNSGLIDAYLLYYLKTENVTNYNIEYSPTSRLNADTINKSNYILTDRNVDDTKMKKPIYSNEFFNLYD